MAFYYHRLEHVRDDEGRRGERLRLWDRLGELLRRARPPRRRGHRVRGRAHARSRQSGAARPRLADLYLRASPKHDAAAIAHHQAVLAGDKKRRASYGRCARCTSATTSATRRTRATTR